MITELHTNKLKIIRHYLVYFLICHYNKYSMYEHLVRIVYVEVLGKLNILEVQEVGYDPKLVISGKNLAYNYS